MLSWGTILYYADRDTGDIREVVVDEIDEQHFYFYYGGRKYRGGEGVIGVRLFLSPRDTL